MIEPKFKVGDLVKITNPTILKFFKEEEFPVFLLIIKEAEIDKIMGSYGRNEIPMYRYQVMYLKNSNKSFFMYESNIEKVA